MQHNYVDIQDKKEKIHFTERRRENLGGSHATSQMEMIMTPSF